MALTRRQFHAGAASGALAAVLGGCATRFGAAADTLILHANLLTMDPRIARADSLAIAGDRIVAVGLADDVANLMRPDVKVIDARGLTVLPGFIDAHSHPLLANEAIAANVDYRSIPEVQAALAAKAAGTAPGRWVMGVMYDDTKFVEGRPVNRADLDAVSTEHPIFVLHRGGHTAVVNSKAFETAGVAPGAPDPEGGKFYRDASGYTGRIAERALDVFYGAGDWPKSDRRTNQENVKLITRRMAAAGLTSTTDAYGSWDDWIAYRDSVGAGENACRIAYMPGGEPGSDGAPSAYQRLVAEGLRSGDGDAMLRIGAVKYAVDGSASERTMRMSTPFEGRPDDYGIFTMDEEQLNAYADQAVADGYRLAVHANGDVAIDMVLRTYERLQKDLAGPSPRHRIEHCSLVNPSLLARIKALGVVPAPFYTYAHYHGEKWGFYGKEKMEWMFAHRSFLDYGIPVAPASDYTPGPYEPMMALQSMVTRKDVDGNVWGPSQRISVEQALQICTMNGAYASFEEDIKGSISPGKLADIVFLESDPRDIDPDALKEIGVVRTMMGGDVTHEA